MLGTSIECLVNCRLNFMKTVEIKLDVRYEINKFPKYRVNLYYKNEYKNILV